MADVVQLAAPAGGTYYLLARNRAAQIWNGLRFEAYTSANYGLYAATIPYQQQQSAPYYTAALPADVVAFPSGLYYFASYRQTGPQPAEQGDSLVGFGSESWNAATGSFSTIDNQSFTLDSVLGSPPGPAVLQSGDDTTLTVRHALWAALSRLGLTATVRPGVVAWCTPNGWQLALVQQDDPVYPQNLSKASPSTTQS